MPHSVYTGRAKSRTVRSPRRQCGTLCLRFTYEEGKAGRFTYPFQPRDCSLDISTQPRYQLILNSDSRAACVTWFLRERGIGLHYFPSVPKSAASHGCVRLERKSVAQLIQSNSRIGLTSVVVDGSWTKPSKQW